MLSRNSNVLRAAGLFVCVTFLGLAPVAHAAGITWFDNQPGGGSIQLRAGCTGSAEFAESDIYAQTVVSGAPLLASIGTAGLTCSPTASASGDLQVNEWTEAIFSASWEAVAQSGFPPGTVIGASTTLVSSMGFTVSHPSGVDVSLALAWDVSNPTASEVIAGIWSTASPIAKLYLNDGQTHSGVGFDAGHLEPGDYYLAWYTDQTGYPRDGTLQGVESSIIMQVVPIPAAGWLFGGALGALGWMRRGQARFISIARFRVPFE